MSLCLARTEASGKPGYLEVALDATVNRTGDTWHVCIPGLKDVATLCYGWRADAADISQFYPGKGSIPQRLKRLFNPHSCILHQC